MREIKNKSTVKSETEVENTSSFSIWPVFLLILIDMIGIGIVIPVLAPLLISTNLFFNASVSFEFRSIILGVLMATYPLAQFIGAPIFGALSDRFGRKKILNITMLATGFGYFVFAFGILFHSLLILFISRIISGFMGGNITVAQSSIADISSPKDKAKRFGIVGMAFGLGLMIGPFLGGKLSDPNILPFFDYATPFFFTAILCVINWVIMKIQFKETNLLKRSVHVDLFSSFRNVKKAFKSKHLGLLFIFDFLFSFGFTFYSQFLQVYFIEKFNFTASDIGNFFGFLGICIIIVQGVVVRVISKKYSPIQILPVSTIMVSIIIMCMLIPQHSLGIFFIVPFLAIFQGLSFPNMLALVSNLTPKNEQGEMIGIYGSVTAMAMAIPPLIAGFVAAIHYFLPIVVGSVVVFLSWIVLLIFIRKNKSPSY